MKKLIAIFLCCLVFSLTGCGPSTKPDTQINTSKLQVVVSFNAMRELTQAIGKDKVEIRTIVPDGTEPHDFEPKATDLTALSQAKVCILNGMGMEPWADKALEAANNKKLVTIYAAEGIEPITPVAKSLFARKPKEDQHDPHTWLSLKNAAMESEHIRDALIKADPENKDYYEKNYIDFQSKLNTLYETYRVKFESLPSKTFVTGHAAFGYMARDFNLYQDSLTDVFAAGEPSARRLAELTDFCRNNHIKVIFVENMENPKIAQTLAKETGGTIESLDTLESQTPGKDYITVMQENLEKIYQSMQ